MKKNKNVNSSRESSISKMFRDMGSDRKIFFISIIVISIAKLCAAVAPKYSGKITDMLTESAGTGSFSFGTIIRMCIFLAILYFVGNIADGVTNKIFVKISQNLVLKYRNRAQKKLNYLPLNYLDTHPAGDILSRVTNDVQTFSNCLESSASTLIGQFVLLVGVIVMMLVTNSFLTLIYLIMLPIGLGLTAGISKVSKKSYRAQQEVTGQLNGMLGDTYSNHMIVKSYGCEAAKNKEFERLNQEFWNTYVKSRFVGGFMIPISVLVGNLSYITLCVVGGMLLIQQKMTLGDFQAFLFFGNMVSSPLSQMANSMNSIQNGLTALDHIYEFLEEEEEPKEQPEKILDVEKVEGDVEFSHIGFGYLPEKPLMHDVSLHAKPGMVMAVVGPSGAGKTTLINLLMRFYEIQKGHIYVDGVDTKEISKENLRRAFGMVLQDTWIFDGTIADNIGYGKPDATREEIIEAAKVVKCDSFIDKLPDGYDTYISESNSALSSGEKQLLAIARTVLADPKILILDEATSQVDTKTEFLITKAMENMMQNRTSFMIAHRLFTIRNADCIIYMEEGDIKEVGNHEQLMRLGGRYASLYNSASASVD